jgi:hypothetical protein
VRSDKFSYGMKDDYLLALEMEIFSDMHDGDKTHCTFVQSLNEICLERCQPLKLENANV